MDIGHEKAQKTTLMPRPPSFSQPIFPGSVQTDVSYLLNLLHSLCSPINRFAVFLFVFCHALFSHGYITAVYLFLSDCFGQYNNCVYCWVRWMWMWVVAPKGVAVNHHHQCFSKWGSKAWTLIATQKHCTLKVQQFISRNLWGTLWHLRIWKLWRHQRRRDDISWFLRLARHIFWFRFSLLVWSR